MKRTCGNGTLRKENAGQEVTLIGWTARRRNLGSLVFVDLRDRSGLLQIVFDEQYVGTEGFEPPRICLTSNRSTELSYAPKKTAFSGRRNT